MFPPAFLQQKSSNKKNGDSKNNNAVTLIIPYTTQKNNVVKLRPNIVETKYFIKNSLKIISMVYPIMLNNFNFFKSLS